MEFRILRGARRLQSKLTTLAFRRADFVLFKWLLGSVPWDMALKARESQETWLLFKDRLLQAQQQTIPNEQKVRQACLEATVDEQGAPGKTKTQEGSIQEVEVGTGHTVQACRDEGRKAKAQLELDPATDVNGNKKGFCKDTGGKRKARGNVVPQPNDWAFSDAAQPDNTGHGKG